MTMDELIAQGYCFFIGRTVVKPDLAFCTIRNVTGDTVAQARALTAADAIAEAIGSVTTPARTTTMKMPKPAMPGMPTMPAARPAMPGMPQPKGTN